MFSFDCFLSCSNITSKFIIDNDDALLIQPVLFLKKITEIYKINKL